MPTLPATIGSFNSQPPEGGWPVLILLLLQHGCFNSQPPEGGWVDAETDLVYECRFNSQPPEGGWVNNQQVIPPERLFQLTAARRRLA